MFSKKGYNADAKLLISLGLRHYPSSFSSSFLSISVIDAIVSISIPLAYIFLPPLLFLPLFLPLFPLLCLQPCLQLDPLLGPLLGLLPSLYLMSS